MVLLFCLQIAVKICQTTVLCRQFLALMSLSEFCQEKLSFAAISFYALSLLFGSCRLSEFTLAEPLSRPNSKSRDTPQRTKRAISIKRFVSHCFLSLVKVGLSVGKKKKKRKKKRNKNGEKFEVSWRIIPETPLGAEIDTKVMSHDKFEFLPSITEYCT